MSVISRRIAQELSDEEFRNTYKRARVRSKMVYQIRALRKQREWLQGKLAQVMGKPQSTVSRFEDADYGKLTLETIFEISDAFDLGVIVEFVSYPEFLVRTSNLSAENLYAPSFSTKSLEFLTRDPQAVGYVNDAIQKLDHSVVEINVSDRGRVVSDIKATTEVAEISQGERNV
jgi:transcriptional regulator with XRE-family HTH domain